MSDMKKSFLALDAPDLMNHAGEKKGATTVARLLRPMTRLRQADRKDLLGTTCP
jgi:hypothetical protein